MSSKLYQKEVVQPFHMSAVRTLSIAKARLLGSSHYKRSVYFLDVPFFFNHDEETVVASSSELIFPVLWLEESPQLVHLPWSIPRNKVTIQPHRRIPRLKEHQYWFWCYCIWYIPSSRQSLHLSRNSGQEIQRVCHSVIGLSCRCCLWSHYNMIV